jgi:hypothetical protein
LAASSTVATTVVKSEDASSSTNNNNNNNMATTSSASQQQTAAQQLATAGFGVSAAGVNLSVNIGVNITGVTPESAAAPWATAAAAAYTSRYFKTKQLQQQQIQNHFIYSIEFVQIPIVRQSDDIGTIKAND